MLRCWAVMLLLGCSAAAASAHYNMLLPDKPWAKKGEKVVFTYQFGHPFEHELFDAPKPAGLIALLPNEARREFGVEKTFTKIELAGADGKKVIGWRFEYVPEQRGDHVFVLKTPRIKLEEGHFVEDLAKVVLHVQTQNNWDTASRPFEDGSVDILPMTRPYGLLPGMVFKGRAWYLTRTRHKPLSANPWKWLPVEVEKYNLKPIQNPPPDELITFQTKADKEGCFVTTLPEAGWWGITAQAEQRIEADAKAPVRLTRRATLWVHVDEKK